ncbi:zinc-binding dehydrogenase [Brachybacterium sp. GCM10030267]|uniref:zinc-binding dehydrogenase n=1 Tax=Brachybacterium sp. GCM10030267 TaxID=3273381 RepID=UPI00361D1402
MANARDGVDAVSSTAPTVPSMEAWTTSPTAPGRLELTQVRTPDPGPQDVLVEVAAFAPNPGELVALASAPAGWIPGWDGAGHVVRAAADGSGPPPGARVVFLGADAGWARRRVVPSDSVAEVPETADLTAVAAIPVPMASALRALRRLGSLLGRHLLIVGANSAVGSAAVQLGARSGADVIAVARNRESHPWLRRLGARAVLADVREVTTRVHAALDMVGGPHLVAAYAALEAGGTVVALGHSASQEEHFPLGAFEASSGRHNRAITSFFLGAEAELSTEMAWLAGEVHAGRLDPGPLDVRSWHELPHWVAGGAARSHGRVVFRVE